MAADQALCQSIFAGAEKDPKLADKIEVHAPQCGCEIFSVGQGSPGPVKVGEVLLRVTTSPRDYDPVMGEFVEAPFKKLYSNGLSVLRNIASDQDVLGLVEDGMWRDPDQLERHVWGVHSATVDAVRAITDSSGSKAFGVYDQTVPRRNKTLPPVPTHAGVFLRVPPPGQADRNRLQKDLAGKLKELFEAGQIPLQDFRDGLLLETNAKAARGEFTLPPKTGENK